MHEIDDLDGRVSELGLQGYCCAQVLVMLALEDRGETNQQLVDAAAGLCFGLSEELLCGALAGGALALGVLAGSKVSGAVVSDLVDWFRDEHGTVECSGILQGDQFARLTRCPPIVGAVYREARSLLSSHDEPEDPERGRSNE
jgi:Putative redox-active protein (C_GCAxxG_C_C)